MDLAVLTLLTALKGPNVSPVNVQAGSYTIVSGNVNRPTVVKIFVGGKWNRTMTVRGMYRVPLRIDRTSVVKTVTGGITSVSTVTVRQPLTIALSGRGSYDSAEMTLPAGLSLTYAGTCSRTYEQGASGSVSFGVGKGMDVVPFVAHGRYEGTFSGQGTGTVHVQVPDSCSWRISFKSSY